MTMPGALGMRSSPVSRLLLHWAANDGTLAARSGQVPTVTYPGTGTYYGTVYGANGAGMDLGRVPRFARIDENGDGVLGTETALLLDRNVVTSNDNGSGDTDLGGWGTLGAGTVTRLTGQDAFGAPSATVVRVTGAANGDGTQLTYRSPSQRFPVDPSITVSGSWWLNPAASLVGRSVRARFTFYNGAGTSQGTVDIVLPITRTGWQLRGGTVLYTAIPGAGVVTYHLQLTLTDTGAGSFDVTGVTLANDRMVGSPIPTPNATAQRRGLVAAYAIPPGLRATTMWLRFAPIPGTWTPAQAESGHPVFLAAIGTADTGGGLLSLNAGPNWRLLRSNTLSNVQSVVTQPGGMVYPIELLAQYYADGSVQLALRDAAGTITTGAKSAADANLAVGANADWSTPTFYLGAGYNALAPGCWAMHRAKVAAGVVDWTAMDGLS